MSMKALIFAVATFLGFAAFVSDANAYVCAPATAEGLAPDLAAQSQ